jgi:hypothetical protein
MGGSYFLLTALPGLSPFERPLPAAWMAILAAQFWIVLSYERSPLRTGIQRLSKLDDPAWHRLRRSWGICLLVAVHGAGLWGLFDENSKPQLVAPLVAGVASVLIHQGMLRRSAAYLAIGGLELGLALHLDFLIPSWLGKDQIIWVLLALLLALRLGGLLKLNWLSAIRSGPATAVLGALIFAHVLYHHPWSITGLGRSPCSSSSRHLIRSAAGRPPRLASAPVPGCCRLPPCGWSISVKRPSANWAWSVRFNPGRF